MNPSYNLEILEIINERFTPFSDTETDMSVILKELSHFNKFCVVKDEFPLHSSDFTSRVSRNEDFELVGLHLILTRGYTIFIYEKDLEDSIAFYYGADWTGFCTIVDEFNIIDQVLFYVEIYGL